MPVSVRISKRDKTSVATPKAPKASIDKSLAKMAIRSNAEIRIAPHKAEVQDKPEMVFFK